jgi:preprotein translocase subunit SecE
MSILAHIKESIAELKHVKWPTKNQVINYTILVIVLSAIIGAYIGALDLGFTKALAWIIAHIPAR